jgi:hypothetical protein
VDIGVVDVGSCRRLPAAAQINTYTSLEAGDVITLHGLRNMTLVDGRRSGEVELEDASVVAPDACPVYTNVCQLEPDRFYWPYVCPPVRYSCAKYFSAEPISSNLTNGTGLFGSSITDRSAVLPHTFPPNVSMHGSAMYDDADRLLLYVVAQAPASNFFRTKQISVSLLMRNPEQAQPSPDFAIEIEGKNSFTPRQAMVRRAQYNEQLIAPYLPSTTTYNTAPLLISGFIELVIFQRTPSSGLSSVGPPARALPHRPHHLHPRLPVLPAAQHRLLT